MGYEVTIALSDEAEAEYRRQAELSGRTLEAEVAAAVERKVAIKPKDGAKLLVLSKRLMAMSNGVTSDSTPYIRWSRDTNAGRLPGSPPFREDDADR